MKEEQKPQKWVKNDDDMYQKKPLLNYKFNTFNTENEGKTCETKDNRFPMFYNFSHTTYFFRIFIE